MKGTRHDIGRRARRSLALSTTLAVIVVLLSAGAGYVGSSAWRSGIQDQARNEFQRQANKVRSEFDQHLRNYDPLFTQVKKVSGADKRLETGLGRGEDMIKQYPGVMSVGVVGRDTSGRYQVNDEFSAVASFGIVDINLSRLVGPEMQTALAGSAATDRRTASPRAEFQWITAAKQPYFFLVEAWRTPSGEQRWTVAMVFGNWVLQDAIQTAGSSFRAELLDGNQVVAQDYLPIGSLASNPPPPIPVGSISEELPIGSYGRAWTLRVADVEGVTRPRIGTQPTLLFLGVSLLGLLSGLLLWVQGRSRSKALRMVDAATSDLRRSEAQLRHQAFHDGLTGLANRALFNDRVSHALAQRRDGAGGIAVLLCDLDDFKTVNDSLGHGVGDALLEQVAERLEGSVRGGDTVARLGGDEFAVLLEAPVTETDAQVAAERILAALDSPVRIEDREVTVGSSIGIAVEPIEGTTGDALVRDADVAMYLAKAEGKGRSAVFRPAMHEEVVNRLAMRADLEGAIARDELVLHYQPVYDLDEQEIIGVEALLRWQHPKHGLIMPSDFIGLTEETGHIIPIGRIMLRRACEQVMQWNTQRPDDKRLHLAFNLSIRQLDDPMLVDDVLTSLRLSGLQPADLTLEITESLLMRNLELSIEQLKRLKGLGVRIAVDDFGTGYSSLGYLQSLPVDILKIDRSFIAALSDPDADPALVRAVVDLATNLGLDTVAEGIEGLQQLDMLRRLSCRQGQGYHFARPLAPEALWELLGVGATSSAV